MTRMACHSVVGIILRWFPTVFFMQVPGWGSVICLSTPPPPANSAWKRWIFSNHGAIRILVHGLELKDQRLKLFTN